MNNNAGVQSGSTTHTNAFLSDALAQVPRLLGQLNRNPSSHSYGSFDRAYWHYRTNDISACRYQEAVYTLALLYSSDFPGNQYYHDAQVLEWVYAALRFTCTLQRANGSFDEWYIHEGSFVGTAFLTAAVSGTVRLLMAQGHVLPESDVLERMLKRSATYLSSYDEHTVLNQVSGAVYAVASVGYLYGDSALSDTAQKMLRSFLAKQHAEGWWSEYGGPDIGYLSLTVSYLDMYRTLTASEEVDLPIKRACEFISTCIHPDHTAGGEYMARNTEYIIPSPAVPYLGALNPSCLDDRYLCYILYNWILTGMQTSPQEMVSTQEVTFFPGSSICKVARDELFFITNGSKGGAFRLYYKGNVYYDSGLEITIGGNVHSTGSLNTNNKIVYKEGVLHVLGYSTLIQEPLMSTGVMLVFKLFQSSIGRLALLQQTLKKFLRKKMISYAGTKGVQFERSIQWSETAISVTDVVRANVTKNDILFGVKAAYTAVPSSKYAPHPELAHRSVVPVVTIREQAGVIEIERVFSVSNL